MIPPCSPRYDTLDAWRGLACVLVVLHHGRLGIAGQPDYPAAGGLPGVVLDVLAKLLVGVPLFFVISEYCIAAAADSAHRAGGHSSPAGSAPSTRRCGRSW